MEVLLCKNSKKN